MTFIKSINSAVNSYYQSKSYEEDLDSLINALHVFSKHRPTFDNFKSLADRTRAKKKFLMKQAALACLAQAAIRSKKGILFGDPGLTLTLAVGGVGEAVVVILFTVSGIVIKRMINGVEVECLKGADVIQ